ncbi:MAG: site-specific DNA-methyltransferase [Thermoprotei archaeon]|nr:MAG: site-specific DNA-methyltransferase [Thermoprotei archaeon]
MADNKLYYGDNLDILRRYIKDESVDLIYLDPPFKSEQDYNILFAEQNGTRSAAQIKAFEDTWHWDQASARAYEETVETSPEPVSRALQAFRKFLGENDMLAYLSMMAPRLLELRRVLKETGSIYLHCDPAASHYLKMLMDAVFGPVSFRNEIVWKRTSGHSDARRYGRVHDILLYYGRGESPDWYHTYQPYDEAYVQQYYRYQDDDGRKWMSGDLSASGLSGGGYEYEWKGVTRVWRCPKETMERLDNEGSIFYTRTGIPRLKRYLDEAKGLPVQDVWTDIEALRSWHQERLSYPTQKPEGILERIITTSSKKGDIVLDPFCGCGTAIAVAQRLERRWIGIDITHLAISLIKHRLHSAFGAKAIYDVIGEPVDLSSAMVLAKEDPYQFQFWALGLVGARPTDPKKGADKGIDGRLYFHDDEKNTKQIIFSVKSGKVGVSHIRDLRGVVEREKAEIGVYISLNEPTKPMRKEAASAGFYTFGNHKYAKLQLLTIEELLKGKRIDYPGGHGGATFKKAPKARNPNETENLPLD